MTCPQIVAKLLRRLLTARGQPSSWLRCLSVVPQLAGNFFVAARLYLRVLFRVRLLLFAFVLWLCRCCVGQCGSLSSFRPERTSVTSFVKPVSCPAQSLTLRYLTDACEPRLLPEVSNFQQEHVWTTRGCSGILHRTPSLTGPRLLDSLKVVWTTLLRMPRAHA